MLDWKRCKEVKPTPHATVILHTPQWSETEGDGVMGYWDGSEWEASDGRGWDDAPPVHWAYVDFPLFQGDEDEWPEDEFEGSDD